MQWDQGSIYWWSWKAISAYEKMQVEWCKYIECTSMYGKLEVVDNWTNTLGRHTHVISNQMKATINDALYAVA